MKFQVQFKTPDVIENALSPLSPDWREDAENLMLNFIRFGEVITIEFDTDYKTATVVKK